MAEAPVFAALPCSDLLTTRCQRTTRTLDDVRRHQTARGASDGGHQHQRDERVHRLERRARVEARTKVVGRTKLRVGFVVVQSVREANAWGGGDNVWLSSLAPTGEPILLRRMVADGGGLWWLVLGVAASPVACAWPVQQAGHRRCHFYFVAPEGEVRCS